MPRRVLVSNRRGRNCVRCCSGLLHILVGIGIGLATAPVGQASLVSSNGNGGDVEEESSSHPQVKTWNALTDCVRDSKEERALERWLLCVERIRSPPELPGFLELYDQDADAAMKPGEEYDTWLIPEQVEAQEARWREPMKLHTREEEQENLEPGGAQELLHVVKTEVDGSGLYEMEDLSRSKERNLRDSVWKISNNASTVSGIMNVRERQFITGPADVVEDEASDSESRSRKRILFAGGDESQGSVSGSGNEMDEGIAGSKATLGQVNSQQADNNLKHPANSEIERLESCASDSLLPVDRLQNEQNVTTSTSEFLSSPGDGGAITTATVVGLLTLMLIRAQRGRDGGRARNQPDMDKAGSNIILHSSTPKLGQKLHIDMQKLSEPLGMAVAQVFFEVLEQNGDHLAGQFSAEGLSNLLESAIKESLMPVLGTHRLHFVQNFRASFNSTYRTRARVRSAYFKAGVRQTPTRQASSKSWKVSQPKSRQEFHKAQRSGVVERNADVCDEGRETPTIEGETSPFRVDNDISRFKDDKNSFFTAAKQDEQDYCGETSSDKYVSASAHSQLGLGCQREVFKLGEEYSQDEVMYSADDSSGGEEWIMLEESSKLPKRARQSDSSFYAEAPGGHNEVCDPGLEEQGSPMCKRTQPYSSFPGDFSSAERSQWEAGLHKGQDVVTPEISEHVPSTGKYLDHSGVATPSDDIGRCSDGVVPGSVLGSKNPQVSSPDASEDMRGSSIRELEQSVSLQGRYARGGDVRKRSGSATNSFAQSQGTAVHSSADSLQSADVPTLDALVLARSSSTAVGYTVAAGDRFQQELFQRHVSAQERRNYLLEVELAHKIRGLAIKEDHLHLYSESNSLLRENVDLSRTKVEFKENEFQDRKLDKAYNEFSRTCADQLVAGLCVMLLALGFSFWKFSYERLTSVVRVCQPPVRENVQNSWLGTNWVYNSLNALTFQLQAFTCEATKAIRMSIGLGTIIFVAATLLRRSVTSSSQAMPATIIVIVLGGVCGFAGKLSIDTLGGSGLHWVVLWECYCSLHAFATCFTPPLYHFLNGHPPRSYFEKAPLGSRICSAVARFTFHSILVLILPLMTGLLPFASPEDILQIFLDWWSPSTSSSHYRVIP